MGGVNLYNFARNSPLDLIDRYGLTIQFAANCPMQFIETWRSNLLNLMTSPFGSNLLFIAAGPSIDIAIATNTIAESSGPFAPTPDNGLTNTIGTIFFNPDDPSGIGFEPIDPDDPDPPADPLPSELPPSDSNGGAVTAAHELGHLLFDTNDPFNVSLWENPVRLELGIPPRETYHGIPIWY